MLRDVICRFCSGCCDLDLCRDTNLQVLCWLVVEHCPFCPQKTIVLAVGMVDSADCITCWLSASATFIMFRANISAHFCWTWLNVGMPILLSRGSCERAA